MVGWGEGRLPANRDRVMNEGGELQELINQYLLLVLLPFKGRRVHTHAHASPLLRLLLKGDRGENFALPHAHILLKFGYGDHIPKIHF